MKESILVVTTSYPKRQGDVNGVFVHDLCRNLKKDYDVFVVAPWEKGLAREEVIDGVRVSRHRQFLWHVNFAYGTDIMTKLGQNPILHLVVPFFLVFQLMYISKMVKRHGIRLIHAHWLIPSALVTVIYKSLFNRRIRIITTLLGADVWSFNRGWKQHIAKFVLHHVDTVTSQSPPLLEEVKRMGYNGRGMVLPIGLDTSIFSPAKQSTELRHCFGNNGLFLLFVGTLIDRKGVVPLVEAAAMLREKGLEFTLLMVGSGEREAHLRQMITEKELQQNVILAGTVPYEELPPYFATADIFILPSLSEGFPLVVMAALSSGTLPVVSDLSVFTAHENRDELFTIVKAGNAESIAEVVADLLANPNRMIEKKQQLRNFAVNNLEISIIAKQYGRLFDELLDQPIPEQ
jgi:glycosyltransferase involved in cell wall biosynthesis